MLIGIIVCNVAVVCLMAYTIAANVYIGAVHKHGLATDRYPLVARLYAKTMRSH